MTKVSVLGQELKKELEKIELTGCLVIGCKEVNLCESPYDYEEGFLDNSTYDELILIAKDYGLKDLILAIKGSYKILFFGHWNDGVA